MSYKATYRTRIYGKGTKQRRTDPVPGMRFENSLIQGGADLVGGIDEVGVGAWAGPVAVGAVVLEPGKRIYKIRDSKLLDAPRREWLSTRVKSRCISWSIGLAWPDEIDEHGLSEAMRRAGARAVAGLSVQPDAFLLDGNWNFIGDRAKTIVRGDCASVSIAAASIVAKVARDRLMADLAPGFPWYRFDSNKGYPSPSHKWALAAFGPSPMHRRLFAPVRRLVDEGTPGRLLPGR